MVYFQFERELEGEGTSSIGKSSQRSRSNIAINSWSFHFSLVRKPKKELKDGKRRNVNKAYMFLEYEMRNQGRNLPLEFCLIVFLVMFK